MRLETLRPEMFYVVTQGKETKEQPKPVTPRNLSLIFFPPVIPVH